MFLGYYGPKFRYCQINTFRSSVPDELFCHKRIQHILGPDAFANELTYRLVAALRCLEAGSQIIPKADKTSYEKTYQLNCVT